MYTIKIIYEFDTREQAYDNEEKARRIFKACLKLLEENNENCPQDVCILLKKDDEVLEEEYLWAYDEEDEDDEM